MEAKNEVHFKASTRDGEELGLDGFEKNLSDGYLYIEAEGVPTSEIN